jgi:hypothetical protein
VPQQPLLFRSQGQYFVKADHVALPVTDAGCLVEAAEFLFMCPLVFSMHYPCKVRYL